ncbi:penicillin-binding protein 2 [Thermoanaerobacterium sp. RBIITD]|uniref:peptidoglycan D,D-transpeptidase FtsI family protein n=1 Tax=Thermoanaerobacterium sp. RBIITD TaxID=1550240 RepID=UPI000BB8CA1D|nr:penicillin-binding protein 2 [Thermoanaerobacterium sp. RBIITD]SNX55334.1 penicillin-binding protein 2 [Thermoanaerobacterium sp. RBIITD]
MCNKITRLVILAISLTLLTIGLMARLFYIQVIKGESYAKIAVEQKIKSLNLGQKRGEIYDRNLIPFTDRTSTEYIYAVPGMIIDKELASTILSKITENPKEKIFNDLNSKSDFLKYKCLNTYNSKLPIGIFKLDVPERYDTNTLARHIIGYYGSISSGLEHTFDRALRSYGNESIAIFKDNYNDYLKGLGVKVRSTSDNVFSIETTLDYHIQKAVENILDKNNINGAAVVLDVKNGDILAMASRPNYDQNKISSYLDSTNEELMNKALMAYPPGSIFKIIVASAALENGKVNIYDNFIDEPYININSVVFHNFMDEANGIINIDKAFEVSSNTTFIKIGQNTGGDKIINMAKKFGITIDDNLPIEEEIGTLPSIKNTYGAGIGNLSIGQGDVSITPLQAADIAATIANNGIRHVPNLLKSIVDENGKEIENLHKNDSYRVVSENTAIIVKKMMRDVVTNGTGKNAETEYGSAGKTGSAEVNKELNIYHAWFTGFVPYDKPKYAISIFVKNGDIGGIKAAPIFKDIAGEIMKYYR